MPFKATGGETFASFFGLRYDPLHSIIFLYYVILGLALLTSLFTLRLRRLPIGRAWEAMREDEIACRSLGISTTVDTEGLTTAFATGAMLGGLAGAFFAARQGFVEPDVLPRSWELRPPSSPSSCSAAWGARSAWCSRPS